MIKSYDNDVDRYNVTLQCVMLSYLIVSLNLWVFVNSTNCFARLYTIRLYKSIMNFANHTIFFNPEPFHQFIEREKIKFHRNNGMKKNLNLIRRKPLYGIIKRWWEGTFLMTNSTKDSSTILSAIGYFHSFNLNISNKSVWHFLSIKRWYGLQDNKKSIYWR